MRKSFNVWRKMRIKSNWFTSSDFVTQYDSRSLLFYHLTSVFFFISNDSSSSSYSFVVSCATRISKHIYFAPSHTANQMKWKKKFAFEVSREKKTKLVDFMRSDKIKAKWVWNELKGEQESWSEICVCFLLSFSLFFLNNSVVVITNEIEPKVDYIKYTRQSTDKLHYQHQ